jgi:hypothetical protein
LTGILSRLFFLALILPIGAGGIFGRRIGSGRGFAIPLRLVLRNLLRR